MFTTISWEVSYIFFYRSSDNTWRRRRHIYTTANNKYISFSCVYTICQNHLMLLIKKSGYYDQCQFYDNEICQLVLSTPKYAPTAQTGRTQIIHTNGVYCSGPHWWCPYISFLISHSVCVSLWPTPFPITHLKSNKCWKHALRWRHNEPDGV